MAEINFSRDAKQDSWIQIQNGQLETIQDWRNRIEGYDRIGGRKDVSDKNNT